MNKIEQLNEEIKAARIAKDSAKLQLLGTLKGEVDTTLRAELKEGDVVLTAEVILANTAKKMVKGINEFLKHREDPTLRLELTWLEDYIPKTLTKEEITLHLNHEKFLTLDAKGMMPAAMKYFRENEMLVNGNDVKEVISELQADASISN